MAQNSCIEHFSHEHPLIFFQANDFEDPKPYRCSICGLPILYSPSYTCSIDANCNFFLHKPCTQLPKELYHDDHSDTLNLERQTFSSGENESLQTFMYKCREYSECKFDVHPLVAKPLEIKSKHISHSPHPLVVFCREMFSRCDVCGEEQWGFFFHCQACNFWIHQYCTILPSIVKLRHQPNPYILSYSLSFKLVPSFIPCSICREPRRLQYNGVYFCCESYKFAHVTCAMSKMEDLQTTIEELIQLPDEEDTSPSLVIRRSAERNPSAPKCHKHPLILVDSSNREAERADSVCDICMQPIYISSLFYRCQSDDCHFLSHDICANHLPTSIQLFYPGLSTPINARLQIKNSDICKRPDFNSVVLCIICLRPSNGIVYCLENEGEDGFGHIECVLAPKVIKHASHRQHLLYQMHPASKSSIPILSCCSGESLFFDTYRCAACDFAIHVSCALLPKKTRHKFDEHPLELIMRHGDKQEVFCEVCEEDINVKLWHYGCHECEQYFHINCIPSVGYLSKVKFGKTLADDNIHPNHPLTLTRMLTHATHERCGYCNQIIQGFAHDQMAFHCSQCNFWIHFSCASATTSLRDYSQYREELKKRFRDLLKI